MMKDKKLSGANGEMLASLLKTAASGKVPSSCGGQIIKGSDSQNKLEGGKLEKGQEIKPNKEDL